MFKRDKKLACSFCGKRDFEVEKLVAGPRVYICDACVALASQIMQSGSSDRQTGRGRAGSLIQRVAVRLRRMMPGRHDPHRSEFHTLARHAYEKR
jgi:hypothetical protein